MGERTFDKICKGRKLNPRPKYQNLPPPLSVACLTILVTDEESSRSFEFLMSPL